MAEIETFDGIPVAVFELVDRAIIATLVPVTISIGAQLYHNYYDPVAQAQISAIKAQPSVFSLDNYTEGLVEQTSYTIGAITLDQSFLIYIGAYFSTLFGGLISLMFYNLLAMFGLDVKIGDFGRSLVKWWTTPPTAEELAAFEEGNPSNEEDDDMKAAEEEEAADEEEAAAE